MKLSLKIARVEHRQQVCLVSGLLICLSSFAGAQNIAPQRQPQATIPNATVRNNNANHSPGELAVIGQPTREFKLIVPRLTLKPSSVSRTVAAPPAKAEKASQAIAQSAAVTPTQPLAPPIQPSAYSELQSVMALNGGRVRLADWMQQGEYPVLVSFWATWCGVCRQELDFLKVLTQQYAPYGLKVVTLTVEDPQEAGAVVRNFVQRNQFNFPVYYATAAACAQLNGGAPCNSIPRTFIIGRNGRVIDRMVGYNQMALVNSVRVALAQPASARAAARTAARRR